MKREWRALLALIVLNVLAFGAIGYWTGIAPRLRAVAELKAHAQAQVESLAELMSRLPPSSRTGVIAQIPPSLGSRVVLVHPDGSVVQDSAGEFAPASHIQRNELQQVERGRPLITVERLPSGNNALYAFAQLDDGLILINIRRAEGVTMGDTLTLVSLFLLTSVAQSIAIYGLARYRRNQEQRQLEERLAMAHRHDTIQREFMANAAHELRTPIWSIKLFAEEVANHQSQAQLQQYLDPILRAADRLSALVSQLLDLSKLEAGILQPQCSWVDVQTWLTGITRMLTPQAQEAKARLVCACSDTGQVWCDPQLLGQAVSNLVENALKYGGTGVGVTVHAARQSDRLVIAVQDTGPGIGAEHLPHIFERFYRVDKDRSRKKGGSGLGLAIVQGIVQVHGGTVTARSQVGVGTTMTISVPLAES